MSDKLLEKYGLWLVLFVWLISLITSLLFRQSLPIDETRYLSVAWEMWANKDFLVPHINGEPYAHKPPLIFWIINLSWFLFGVSECSARLSLELVSLTSLLLVYPLARLLWPSEKKIAVLASWIVLTILVWNFWSEMIMFDLLLGVCAELGWIGMLLVWRKGLLTGWVMTGIATGMGILAKGPVILIFILPVALLAPWWFQGHPENSEKSFWPVWYSGIMLALLAAAAIALAWALPAGVAGGKAYHDAILWGQTANRVVKSFAHSRAWWWYLPLLPFLLYPWSFWFPLWRQGADMIKHNFDAGIRFVLTIFIAGLVLFSLISGKQIHYLIPLFPAFSLFAAKILANANQPMVMTRFGAIFLTLLPTMVGFYIISTPFIEHSPKLPESLASPHWYWSFAFLGFLIAAVIKPHIFSKPSAVGLLSSLFFLCCFGAFIHPMSQDYNLKPIAEKIAERQALGEEVAFTGSDYKAEFNFYGRLRQPLQIIPENKLEQWRQTHKRGGVVKIVKQKPSDEHLSVQVWNKSNYYLWLPPVN